MGELDLKYHVNGSRIVYLSTVADFHKIAQIVKFLPIVGQRHHAAKPIVWDGNAKKEKSQTGQIHSQVVN